jgi:hypothetical protein
MLMQLLIFIWIDTMPEKIGELRRSQLVSTFGTGAIVDLTDYSVMIAGLDFWQNSNLETLSEPRLQALLDVYSFKQPLPASSDATEGTVPCVRFPSFIFCPKCRKLGHYDDFGGANEKYCRNCKDTEEIEGESRLVPSRFVITCRSGHIADFPWQYWIACQCENPQLKFHSKGQSTSLSSISISCVSCTRKRNMAEVFSPDSFRGFNCPGNRPWLKDVVPCSQPIVVLQRSATSVHYPITQSSISIPPYSRRAYRIVDTNWHRVLEHIAGQPDAIIRPVLQGFAHGEGLPVEDLINAFDHFRSDSLTEDSASIKEAEYRVLRDPADYDEKDDFIATKEELPGSFSQFFSTLVLIKKLRVVTAYTGFNRIEPNTKAIAPLFSHKPSWLPGMEVSGEGLFFEFHPDALTEWLNREREALQKRAGRVESRRATLADKNKLITEDPATCELLLIHTFSHLLMRSLTLRCGYSSTALSERLYVQPQTGDQPGMHGLLIYTAASDSEGSLGGLVTQGARDRISDVLKYSVEQAKWCSSDPLCIESTGQGTDSLNLGACHSCSLVPETACEYMNGFLDRGVVIGTPENRALGFFSELD